jgi:hypothetical protein
MIFYRNRVKIKASIDRHNLEKIVNKPKKNEKKLFFYEKPLKSNLFLKYKYSTI